MGIKPIKFETYGPCPLRREEGAVTSTTLEQLWADVPGVATGIGVYIFFSKAGKKLTPWYVGKTDKGFRKRLYRHLLGKKTFPRLIAAAKDEELAVMFLARHTEGERLKNARKPNALTKTKAVATIDRLEYDVLQKAFAQNDGLLNKSKRVYIAKLSVPGFSGPRREENSTSANALRSLLGT